MTFNPVSPEKLSTIRETVRDALLAHQVGDVFMGPRSTEVGIAMEDGTQVVVTVSARERVQ